MVAKHLYAEMSRAAVEWVAHYFAREIGLSEVHVAELIYHF